MSEITPGGNDEREPAHSHFPSPCDQCDTTTEPAELLSLLERARSLDRSMVTEATRKDWEQLSVQALPPSIRTRYLALRNSTNESSQTRLNKASTSKPHRQTPKHGQSAS